MGGSKTAILAQVVHFYSDGVGHITIGGNTFLSIDMFRSVREAIEAPRAPSIEPVDVLEDFARSSGLILACAASPLARVWVQVMREEGSGSGGSRE
jgi:hypothetical protein